MKWIEVIGTSGVGKTTFVKTLAKFSGQERDWLMLNEALIDLARTSSNRNALHFFLKIYLSQNLTQNSKRDIADILFKKKKAYLDKSNLFSTYFDSYLKYYYKNRDSSSEKVYRIALYKSIVENLCAFIQAGYSRPVVLDEGLINHHPNLLDHNWDETKIFPSGLVFCHLNPDEIFERVKKREQKRGRPSPLHREMDNKKLKEDIMTKMENLKDKREKLISQGIPYIDINLKDINHSKLRTASEFINKIKNEML